jgi:hypothetical protein
MNGIDPVLLAQPMSDELPRAAKQRARIIGDWLQTEAHYLA